MDGISITSSIAGLLTVAYNVAGFISKMGETPSLIQSVLSEITEIGAGLSQLQNFLLLRSTYGNGGASELSVRHIIITLVGCVQTFSQLEKDLDTLRADSNSSWDRARWALKENDFRDILGALQNYMVLLNLILNIINW
jgi:hypothetical protein